ncbi:MAG TPA: LysM domain-containing protein [Arenicellales bacterium]|nr:LysM domain-containing protein [Arenicellales bacterium]
MILAQNLQPTPAAANPNIALQRVRYRVRRGDSLARISQRFRVSISQLEQWNDLDRRRYLQPGQVLTLYVDVTRQAGNS